MINESVDKNTVYCFSSADRYADLVISKRTNKLTAIKSTTKSKIPNSSVIVRRILPATTRSAR